MGGFTASERPRAYGEDPLARAQGGVEARGSRARLIKIMEGFGPEAGKQFALAAKEFYARCGNDPELFGNYVDALQEIRKSVMDAVPRGSDDEAYAIAIEKALRDIEDVADSTSQEALH